MHIGGLYTALISERLAHQTEGVFYLRIEDTDKRREVSGAADLVVKSLDQFKIKTDEGPTVSGNEEGKYGPYKQSERSTIYKAYVKSLLEKGQAYPCFCTPEELEAMKKQQEAQKLKPGYYGEWAKWRNKSEEEVLQAVEGGKPYVIRFRSNGDLNKKIEWDDVVKGRREIPENDQDVVIMKTDGLPTYHMAHVIDDHLMGTTHVIRGDEWLISTPLHLQLFDAMGWKPPKYGHLAPIQKIEGASKRKLSKRKDPEASVTYYLEQGYPENAVTEYLLNLANSSFEDWRKANPGKDNREFPLDVSKLGGSGGALFDFNKLNDISKEVISKLSGEELYTAILEWSRIHDPEFASLLVSSSEYSKNICRLERDGVDEKKRRKDITKWSDVKDYVKYFFDESFSVSNEVFFNSLGNMDVVTAKSIVGSFMQKYNEGYSKDTWLELMRSISAEHGFAENAKMYKADPGKYKGHLGDVTKVFRLLLTGRTQTPDLYAIMSVMGQDRLARRLALIETI